MLVEYVRSGFMLQYVGEEYSTGSFS